jgi:HK97 family phage prohead protease|tara:strand:- start:3289 stop:4692 length:1404 start_codon:yes stop_codon:yes gene_type:complete
VLSQERLYGVDESIGLLKAGNDLVVAGYASVELVDKQGDLITKEALKDGFRKFMSDPKYRNVQLAHSNIQVGEVVPSYTDTEGRLWKSEVDDVGMFVVIQLRDDIEKAREVAAEIRKGKLRGFSIGGQAFKRVRKSDPRHGDYQEISKLELHEITICEKGINPEATFRILKQETDSENTEKNKVKKMTEDNDMQTQLGDVLTRLETRLDSMEKGMPPQLKEQMKDKKDEDKDDKDKAMDKKDDKDEKMYADDAKKSDDYSDVISSEYLDWMENTLKSAGVDIAGARGHFDDLAKANLGSTPEEFDLDYGQTPNRESEGGKPSTNAIARLGGKGEKKDVKKSDFLTPDLVSESDVEAAYEVYKAAAMEQEFRGSLESRFASRFASERAEEVAKAEAAAYDARGPLDSITKALADLNNRIDNISSGAPVEGIEIQKSAEPAVEIPSTVDMHRMSWDEVHALADKAFRGE